MNVTIIIKIFIVLAFIGAFYGGRQSIKDSYHHDYLGNLDIAMMAIFGALLLPLIVSFFVIACYGVFYLFFG